MATTKVKGHHRLPRQQHITPIIPNTTHTTTAAVAFSHRATKAAPPLGTTVVTITEEEDIAHQESWCLLFIGGLLVVDTTDIMGITDITAMEEEGLFTRRGILDRGG